jgi:hypothetical protein
VTVPTRYLLAAAVGLCLGRALSAEEPAPPVSVNQQVANTIADHLRQNARLSGYRIDVIYQNGIADVYGAVSDQPQKDEALHIVQGVPGVERVRDHLVMSAPVAQVQANVDVPMPRAVNGPQVPAGPMPGVPGAPMMPGAPAMPGMPMMPGMPGAMMPGMPGAMMPGMPGAMMPGGYPGAMMPGGYPGAMEPTPIFQGAGGPFTLPSANMPPYAWSTYAPYNNFSRVAMPTAYPPNAFPFIGPEYPFPKVPLGWRSVKLEWVDGHWWFGKTAQCHDWWRLRYW